MFLFDLLVFTGLAAAPAGAQVVAGAPPGPTLTASAKHDKLTLTLTAPGAEPVTETEDTPAWLDEVVLATAFDAGQVYVGGAVDAAAASVELGFEGGQVIRVPAPGGHWQLASSVSKTASSAPPRLRQPSAQVPW